MNQIFSFKRFRLLLSKYIRDNRQSLVGAAAIVLAFHGITGAFMIYNSLPSDLILARASMFIVQFWFLIAFFTWQQISFFNDRNKAIYWLLFPASQLEKLLLLWLITGLGFLGWYVISFFATDWVGTYYVNHKEWTAADWIRIRANNMVFPVELFDIASLSEVPAITTLTAVHASVLVCTIFFRRYTVIITTLTGVVLLGGIILLNIWFLNQLIDTKDIGVHFPFGSIRVQQTPQTAWRDVELPASTFSQIRWTVGIIVMLLLYASAYFRLKEREV